MCPEVHGDLGSGLVQLGFIEVDVGLAVDELVLQELLRRPPLLGVLDQTPVTERMCVRVDQTPAMLARALWSLSRAAPSGARTYFPTKSWKASE